jgi:hypothetical protein
MKKLAAASTLTALGLTFVSCKRHSKEGEGASHELIRMSRFTEPLELLVAPATKFQATPKATALVDVHRMLPHLLAVPGTPSPSSG